MKTPLYILGIILFSSCTKTENLDDHFVPQHFNFLLTDKSDQPLINDPSQNIKMWYEVNGEKKILDDLRIKPFINSNKYPYYVSTLAAPFKSIDNIKQFYLSIDNGTPNKIYLDVIKTSSPKGTKYVEVKFNDIPIPLDFNHKPEIYVLKLD